MKILSIVGTRPQYVKLAAIYNASLTRALLHDWIDTGQHYSANLSGDLIDEFQIPTPRLNLKVGSGPHGVQTAKMLEGIEEFLSSNNYDVVLVYGDTNSTLAGALAASKLRIPVAHIESGLRSNNMDMPEEQNRRIVDHISTLLFAPTQLAVENLEREGLNSIVKSGDIMFDVLKRSVFDLSKKAHTFGNFVLATVHRVENTDSIERLKNIIRALESLSLPVVLPAHPRLLQRLVDFKIDINKDKIKIIEPLGHKELLEMVINAKCVITDSGGLQKEAFMLHKICITVRNETEWPETLEFGWNVLSPKLDNLSELVSRVSPDEQSSYFGEGNAADIILNELEIRFGGDREVGAIR
jgi:UDP-N-acetylglucosamine 2-epimerase